MSNIKLIKGDCLEKMKDIEDKSIDIVITDIPYNIDYSSWDTLYNNTNSALGGSSEHQNYQLKKNKIDLINLSINYQIY